MRSWNGALRAASELVLGSEAQGARLTVAAAANLADAFNEAAAAFRMETGTEVVLSFGSTAQLAQQIENGAPFDVFAAADTEHIDQLIEKGRIVAETRAVYARGQLALWIPQGEKTGAKSLSDLTRPDIRFIAVAQPELAPYGKAAVEAMKAAGLWEKLEGKLVYANNINMARQYATTGNADAAFTAYSLVLKDAGVIAKIDPKLYTPIDQALGLIASSGQPDLARRFIGYLTSAQGKALLRKGGYLIP
ncbi:MAG: molybdate ABC transporter substrate-binding protein [Acidobacteriota bacterium]